MSDFELQLVPVLRDNYVYLLREPENDTVAIVDPSVDTPVADALDRLGWKPALILNTHHHPDHVGGNAGLKNRYGCDIVAPAADRHRISGVDRWVEDGDEVAIGSARGRVIAVPGHTSGHIAYHFPEQKVLLCGDTLFSLGCGRLFEGTPGQMWASLSRLAALPEETLVCCAHEYTQANGRFAMTLEPGNAALVTRLKEVAALREQDQPTVPSNLGIERETNPFLRPNAPEIRRSLGMTEADEVAVFAEIRRRKDEF